MRGPWSIDTIEGEGRPQHIVPILNIPPSSKPPVLTTRRWSPTSSGGFWVCIALTFPVLLLSPAVQGLLELEQTLSFPGDAFVLWVLATPSRMP
ncbi:MAG: hypothetical protein DRG31_04285 [Deltaproteobacteria bacterium]|nr:MAG: hypothetical protein DRG31_04285 [Deltaproteobacteria bacterium]